MEDAALTPYLPGSGSENESANISVISHVDVENIRLPLCTIGSLQFHGATDIRGLDFTKHVLLAHGCVQVYPSASDKPPAGKGLNKRTTVTMLNCKPSLPVSQMTPEAVSSYKEKVKQMTAKKQAKFVSYDIGSGVWKFEVEHF